MSEPLVVTLSVWQGQTLDLSLVVSDSDDAGNTTVTDLTGYSAEMDVRTDVDAPDRIVRWSTLDGTLVIDGPNGTISFNVDEAATYALSSSNELQIWRYDMRLISPGDVAERLIEGALVLYPATTRPPYP